MEKTLALIKPDVTKRKLEKEIISIILSNGFEIAEMKTLQLTKRQVHDFYFEHIDKPFYPQLEEFMLSGKIIALSLKKENAVAEWRKLMGGKDLLSRERNSIRGKYALSLTQNSVHGSDTLNAAKRELQFFNFDIE